MEVLSVDPGTARLAFSHVEWNGTDASNISNYAVRWACVVNLSHHNHPDGDHAPLTDRYESMTNQLETLESFLRGNTNLNGILSDEGRASRKNGGTLKVVLEQTEGVRDKNVLFSLMRVNMISGYLCSYFRSKGCKVIFLPKTFKLGWTSLNGIVKRRRLRQLGVQDSDKKKKKKNDESAKCKTTTTTSAAKKAQDNTENRKWRKKATCHLVSYVMEKGVSKESAKKDFRACKSYEKMNHIADSVSQAIRYVTDNTHSYASPSDAPTLPGVKSKKKKVPNGSTLCKEAIDYIEERL